MATYAGASPTVRNIDKFKENVRRKIEVERSYFNTIFEVVTRHKKRHPHKVIINVPYNPSNNTGNG